VEETMNGKFNVVRAKNVTILCFNPTLRTPADYRLAGVKSKNQLVRRWISDRAKKELPLNVATRTGRKHEKGICDLFVPL
jgi:hypothetical protein